MRFRSFLLALPVALFSVVTARADAVPGTMTFAGKLANEGTPVTGSRTLTFRLFQVETGGTTIWTEEHQRTLTDGQVNLQLGAMTSLDETVFDGTALYLEVAVDGTALAPRMPVTTVPYAFRAAVADSARTLGNLDENDVVQSISTANGITASRMGGAVALSVNPSVLQFRVRGACQVGEAVRAIAEDGTVLCGPFNIGDVTAVMAGDGLTGGGATADVSLALMSCPSDGILRSGASGWTCSTDRTGGDISAVTAGSGLTGGGQSGDVSLALMSCMPGEGLMSTAAGWICGSPVSGTAGRVVKFGTATTGVNSIIYDDGTHVGVGAAGATYKLEVSGDALVSGWIRTTGNTGWFNESHLGGWNMTDATYVRVYGDKSVVNTHTRAAGAYTDAQFIAERGAGNANLPGIAFLNPGVAAVQLMGNISGQVEVKNGMGTAFAAIVASNVTAPSDVRLKKDIQDLSARDLDDAVLALRNIRSIRYRYLSEVSDKSKADPLNGTFWREFPHLGVSAETLPPEVSAELLLNAEGTERAKGVSLTDMDGLLVAGVKALDARVRTLQDDVAARDRKIAELEQRLAKLSSLEERISRLEAAR